MSKREWTQGPWQVIEIPEWRMPMDGVTELALIGPDFTNEHGKPDNTIIADTSSLDPDPSDANRDRFTAENATVRANYRLMSAAPDLYEALMAALPILELDGNAEVRDAAYAALQKAEGTAR
jgi:hypothetical protein